LAIVHRTVTIKRLGMFTECLRYRKVEFDVMAVKHPQPPPFTLHFKRKGKKVVTTCATFDIDKQ